MRFYFTLVLAVALFSLSDCNSKSTPLASAHQKDTTGMQIVPVGGNTWITNEGAGGNEKISDKGITGWTSKDAVFTTYIRVSHPGELCIRINAGVPTGKSQISISINNEKRDLIIEGDHYKTYLAGIWTIKEKGYIAIKLQGVDKAGDFFANVVTYVLSGAAVDDTTVYVRSNEDNYFYWGRRGPSTHVNYLTAGTDSIEWFYNEVTVPKGYDPVGSYYMANGFNNGYFGIQVNSETERRVLFSVWSPYHTDNPKSIPDSMKIVLLKKGDGVKSGEFGNEGSGGQSYFVYKWITGDTYKFLLRAQPDGIAYTTYTAYFFVPEEKEWKLIASFKRPVTNTYLKGLYSFLESFNPATGNIERKVYFNNQWVGDRNGNWREISNMKFTADATARKPYRLDYAGGEESGKGFYLRSCGFFNDYTPIGTVFSRQPLGKIPAVNFETFK